MGQVSQTGSRRVFRPLKAEGTVTGRRGWGPIPHWKTPPPGPSRALPGQPPAEATSAA